MKLKVKYILQLLQYKEIKINKNKFRNYNTKIKLSKNQDEELDSKVKMQKLSGAQ